MYIKHIHWGGDFGYGLQSISHIESIYDNLKKKLNQRIKQFQIKMFYIS